MAPKNIDEIFWDAAQLSDPAERRAYLDVACAARSAVRDRVEQLLAAQSQAGGFLEFATPDWGATVEGPVPEHPTVAVGPYALREPLGQGGFGLVFRAEQNHPVRRAVALKILKPEMSSPGVIARFEVERQALALMDHPNIARVLDAGETADGRPYFAMELVTGEPITAYCDRNALTVRDRMTLFAVVCRAVQHAHQKGVIHRDIKPANILVAAVDGRAAPKVIDFGIAKAVGEPLTDRRQNTGALQMVGTPLYMSPEQSTPGGIDVDTRSDVYSLGVLLYELLTGSTPVDPARLEGVGYDDLRRIIREEEPPPPSARLVTAETAARRKSDPRRLSQSFRRELDWITMTALEKDRTRRYEAAGALAADVDRYLRDEPVAAGPPSAWYRCRTFGRRHRGAVAVAGGLAAALLVGVAAVAGSVGWAARDRAARDAALDTEVARNLDEAEAHLGGPTWPVAGADLDRAEKFLRSAGRTESPDRLQELRRDLAMARRLEDVFGSPRNQAFIYGDEQPTEYARAFGEFGLPVDTLSVEGAAARIRGRSIRLHLARALDSWSLSSRCQANLRMYGPGMPEWKHLQAVAAATDPDPWRNELRAALASGSQERVWEFAASADERRLPPESLLLLGRAMMLTRLPDGTLRLHVESGPGRTPLADRILAFLRRAQRQYPNDLPLTTTLAEFCRHCDRDDEAVNYFTVALALRPGSAALMCNLGRTLLHKECYPEAVAEFSRALESTPDHGTRAVSLGCRGKAYLELHRPDEAFADFSTVLDLGFDHHEDWWHRGMAYAQLMQWDRAVADFSAALARYPTYPDGLYSRAYVYTILDQWAAAATDLTPERIESVPPDDDRWLQLACLSLLRGDEPGYRQRCRQLLETVAETKQGLQGRAAYIVSRTCLQLPEGKSATDDAFRWAELAMKSNDARGPWCTHTLALAHYRAGRFSQALKYCEQSQREDPRWKGAMSNTILSALAHERLGRHDQARDEFRAVADWRAAIRTGTYKGDPGAPPDMHLSDWLETLVLFREADGLLNPDGRPHPTPEGGGAKQP
jgi:serine/threonine protein kinase/tetratricopeptide (TPR) repeat protein